MKKLLLILLFLVPTWASAASVTFQEHKTATADCTTCTFASANFGTAAADRYVIITGQLIKVTGTDDFTSSNVSITIGGVSATFASFAQHSVGQRPVVFIAVANVPTGTTGDVVITLPADGARDSAVGVYTSNSISATPTDFGSSTAADPTDSINVNASGFIVGVAISASVSTTVSWTGLTERYDTAFGTGPDTHSGASVDSATTQTVSITANFVDNTGSEVGTFASFPASAAATPQETYVLITS